jgi:hypothetical protein
MTLSDDTYQMMLKANRPMEYHEICEVMGINQSTFGGIIFHLLCAKKIYQIGETKRKRTGRGGYQNIKVYSTSPPVKPPNAVVVRLTDEKHWDHQVPSGYGDSSGFSTLCYGT